MGQEAEVMRLLELGAKMGVYAAFLFLMLVIVMFISDAVHKRNRLHNSHRRKAQWKVRS